MRAVVIHARPAEPTARVKVFPHDPVDVIEFRVQRDELTGSVILGIPLVGEPHPVVQVIGAGQITIVMSLEIARELASALQSESYP